MAIRKLYADFGARIRDRRSHLGLSQDAVARQIELSRTSIANIEAGRQAVMLHQVIDIARALDVEARTLLPEDDRHPQLDAEALAANLPNEVQRFIGELVSNPATRKSEKSR